MNSLVELAPIGPVPEESLAPDAFRDEMHELTERAARPGGWDVTDVRRMRVLFDERAPTWNDGRGDAYRAPLRDALARGAVTTAQWCLEIGSGTGLQTPTLAEHFGRVVAIDLASEMLDRAPAGLASRLLADASQLPIRSSSVDAIACVNAFAFPSEYVRVLRPGGCVIFVSTRGASTPIYLAPDELVSSLSAAANRSVAAVTSFVGAARWSVVRFADNDGSEGAVR